MKRLWAGKRELATARPRVAEMAAAAFCLMTFAACAAPQPDPPAIKSLFEELRVQESGLDFVHRLNPYHLNAYLYHSGFACGGACIGDLNGDLLPEIFLLSGCDENALFVNRGGCRFERSAAAGVGDGPAWGAGASMIDIEGDGDLDLYVCNYDSANRLFLNDGAGQFTEAGFKAGIAAIAPSLCSYFADFDNDGDLDLFLLTNRLYSPSGYPRERAWERDAKGVARVKEKWAPFLQIVTPPFKSESPDPWLQEYGHADRLFRNDGVGPDGVPQFKDVTSGSGIEDIDGHGLSALVWDINSDGLPDIYVANDFIDPDRLWLNLGADAAGRFRFRDATDEFLPYTTWFSMGSDVADVNNDGRLDFFVADMAATTHFKAKTTMGEMTGMRRWVMENGWPRQLMRNCLFINSGTGRFTEAAFLAGVARSDWTWTARLADFDLDGRVDLYLTNGIARTFSDSDIAVTPAMRIGRTEWEIYKDQPEMREVHLAFRNDGDLHFSPVGTAWGLAKESMSYASADGDLDGDGDLDLVVCNLTENVSLYRNTAAQRGNHWLQVRLDGAGKNTRGIGAVLTLDINGERQTRLLQPQTGFLSSNESVAHFGLGAQSRFTRLEVQWPGGRVQTIPGGAADRVLELREPKPAALPSEKTASTPLWNEASEVHGLRFKHEEKTFDDYRREFLLPAKLSQFGPGLAVADVNRDGRDDVFVGGASGQAAVLFIQQPDHRFIPLKDVPWASHADSEDMGALFFDADRDGDLDLYVASGSNEWDAGDGYYADHLYLNETTDPAGPAFVEAATKTLPNLRYSGSCVVGADFDRDGDVDLFVGSRSVPGAYPLPPDSVLLRNDGTRKDGAKLLEATDALAPSLRQAGLVTAALWSDVDHDAWPDLFVACEWGPVRLFLNRNGQLAEATDPAGLSARTGWWNSITGADFDSDGDIDYAVGNAGLNTKYGHPSDKKPLVLYRGDFDDRGGYDLVEAKPDQSIELPVRGRSCSGTAMPFIKEKFKTFKAFAAATLSEIYTPAALAKAQRFQATCLESGLLINESKPGRPSFKWQPLPAAAQISPGFGCVAGSLAADPKAHLIMVQNLFTREPETGLWRGGLGAVFRSEANGALRSLEHNATGLVIAGDAKALAVADINGDTRPDFLVTQNNDRLLAFVHSAKAATDTRRPVAIDLIGQPGNPSAAGARIEINDRRRRVLTAESYAGSGYLSQSSPRIFFFPPEASDHLEITVTWPEGRTTHHRIDLPTADHVVRIDRE